MSITAILGIDAGYRRWLEEWDYAVTVLAPDFASFVRALRPEPDDE